MKKHFLALGLLAAVAVPASAQGVYIFGDAGQSKATVNVEDWDASKSDTSYSFGVGYAVNQTFSFEAAYRDLGSFKLFQDDYGQDQIDATAIQASLLAAFPISPVVNVYGRLGISRLTIDENYKDFEDSYYNDSTSDSKNKTFYGVGASYAINDQVSLRAEYNRYAKWEGLRASTLTIGAAYSF